MSELLRERLFAELDALTIVDPHTHINPHAPASATLADILGYHYYTELAHSAGMRRARIEEPGIEEKEKVARLVEWLEPLSNTIQYSWLIEMLQTFFGFSDSHLDGGNWESLYDQSRARMARPNWAAEVMERSKLSAVFLTNEFDDPLAGFDTKQFVPCLRTDDLVFHLAQPTVRQRLAKATDTTIDSIAALRSAIGRLFEHFTAHGAKACAISLPPDFAPRAVGVAAAQHALEEVLRGSTDCDAAGRRTLGQFVFWTLAEHCRDFRLPFDLMIGVHRGVYAGGMHQGRDLYDSRVSLIDYRELLNAFPTVTFPISVLASVTNQELASYAWIFPNVVTSGHWWYSNTPTFIEHDAAARLEAVPRTKQIGYYSDMYKLEFALPKFAMYKRILAKILAERFVVDRRWSEQQAVQLGAQVLCHNTGRIFGIT